MMTFAEAMAYIGSFSRGGSPVRDLSRIGGLMQKLGDPQDKLKFLHIAGTNGKGSVAEYLTNILTEAGYRTGTFTSPFIRHYRDRIRFNGRDIPESAVCSACEILRHYGTVPEEGYSQFEITFAIAMLYFTWTDTELVVLETGVGGLLDCTNIVRNTLVCIFTKIGLDHMAVLGNTVEEIARQKAGIYKPGADMVCSPDCGEALYQILSGIAGTAEDSPLCQPSQAPEDFELLECDVHHTMFNYCGRVYRTGMGFLYQTNNALTAIEAVKALNRHAFTVPDEAVQRGLAKTCLPGRMQGLSEKPLILLDGAHNRDGIRMLADSIRNDGLSPVFGIVGMTHTDAADFAADTLGELFDHVLCVDGFAPNAMPACALRDLFAGSMSNAHAETAPLDQALDIAKEWSSRQKNDPAIVICGSLYLASWFLNEG